MTSYPGDHCCIIYSYPNFSTHGWKKICLNRNGPYGWAFNRSMGRPWNDEVDSLWCGKNVKWTFCRDRYHEYCKSYYGISGAGNTPVSHVGKSM